MTRTRDLKQRRINRIEAIGIAYENADAEHKRYARRLIKQTPLKKMTGREIVNLLNLLKNAQWR